MKRFQIFLAVVSLLITAGVLFFIQVGHKDTVPAHPQFSSSGTVRKSPYHESITELNNLGFVVVASNWDSKVGVQCNNLQEFIDSLRENSISIVYVDDDIAWFEITGNVIYVRL